MTTERTLRRPGRPRAIPEALIPRVLSLYQGGLGYRAIARELTRDGVSVDYCSVRRLIKSTGAYHADGR